MSPYKTPESGFRRRQFLRGAGGITIGLPLLDAFTPRGKAFAAGTDTSFAAFFVNMNGVVQQNGGEPEKFWPKNIGSITRASLTADKAERSIGELSDHADNLLIVKGVKLNFPGNGCGHSGGGNQVLTAHRVSDDPSKNKSLAMGPSVDHIIAQALNPQAREPLALYAGNKAGYINDHISFRAAKNLCIGEGSPLRAYERIVGASGMDNSAGMVDLLTKRRKSVNDVVRNELKALLARPILSGEDRKRIDLHLTSVRDIENKLVTMLPAPKVAEFTAVDKNSFYRTNPARLQTEGLQGELIAFALASGYTRSAYIQSGDGTDGMGYTVNGKTTPDFHMVSHRIFSHGAEGEPIPDAMAMHHEIDRIRLRLWKTFLDKMASYTTPEGNLLDTGFAVWTNALGTGAHTYDNIPFIIAGKAGGYLRTGQFVDVISVTNNKMLNTLATAAGVRKSNGDPIDDLGDPSLPRGLIKQMQA